jgi:hypothetical protein
VLLAHGNQAIQPASVTQPLIHNVVGTNSPTGYHRLIKSHEDHNVPLTLHITPTLASALEWAANPNPGAWPNNDGPSLNNRIAGLVGNGKIDLVGSTFGDHVPKYFQTDFNVANRQVADEFLTSIYGSVSPDIFWAPERVLDDESLAVIKNMGYNYVFADQMRHFLKWFGRSTALGTAGYRINEVNGVKVIPIHDVTSEYLNQTLDQGSPLAVRQLLSRRALRTAYGLLLLACCAVCYLSVRDNSTAHSTIKATANHALNVMVLYPLRVLKPRLLALVRLALGAALLSFRLVNALWRLIRGVSPCLVCVGLVVGRDFRSCCYTYSLFPCLDYF